MKSLCKCDLWDILLHTGCEWLLPLLPETINTQPSPRCSSLWISGRLSAFTLRSWSGSGSGLSPIGRKPNVLITCWNFLMLSLRNSYAGDRTICFGWKRNSHAAVHQVWCKWLKQTALSAVTLTRRLCDYTCVDRLNKSERTLTWEKKLHSLMLCTGFSKQGAKYD